jgi:protein phosphatase
VRRAILQGNQYVINEAHARGNDMGTTLTMALVAGDRAVIGNVGDSRTYMYRDGSLRRISKDHSLVMRLVDLGQITEDDIYTHPQRNAVLRSLGDKPDVEVDVFTLRLKPGDALLLCSDGQWEMTHDPEMAEIIKANSDPQAACAALIAAANAAGGDDNITSVLAKFEKYGE